MSAVPANRPLSAEEYLRWEDRQEERHEFAAGRIVAMQGGSIPHETIIGNITFGLRSALEGRDCRVFASGVKLRIQATDSYRYPDVLVACPPDVVDSDGGVLDNPTLIVEVLSPSTERIDRGAKMIEYATLKSLREYVLVEPTTQRVEIYEPLESGKWTIRLTLGEGNVALSSLGVSIPLPQIYAGVDLS